MHGLEAHMLPWAELGLQCEPCHNPHSSTLTHLLVAGLWHRLRLVRQAPVSMVLSDRAGRRGANMLTPVFSGCLCTPSRRESWDGWKSDTPHRLGCPVQSCAYVCTSRVMTLSL